MQRSHQEPAALTSPVAPSPGAEPSLAPSPRGAQGLGERGMVTAELAVVFPVLALVLAVSLGAFGLALDQVRCVDAARAGARAAARGDTAAAVGSVVSASAPAGAAVSLTSGGGVIRVRVTAPPGGLTRLLPGAFRPSAMATAVLETTDPGP